MHSLQLAQKITVQVILSSKLTLKGFAREADQLLKAGVDAVYCTAVNDPFVLDAFADYLKAKGKITFLSDNGDFAKSIGLEKNIPQVYMGLRTKRYAMVVENHIIKYLGVDEQGLDKSSAESVLKFLSK